MNNDEYLRTITDDRGRVYHYDPDRDIYYRYTELTPFDRWGWIAVTVILAAIAWTLS